MSKENPTIEELKEKVKVLESERQYFMDLAQSRLEDWDKLNLDRLEAMKQEGLAKKRAEVYKTELAEMTTRNYNLICKFDDILTRWREVIKENEELRKRLEARENEEEVEDEEI